MLASTPLEERTFNKYVCVCVCVCVCSLTCLRRAVLSQHNLIASRYKDTTVILARSAMYLEFNVQVIN